MEVFSAEMVAEMNQGGYWLLLEDGPLFVADEQSPISELAACATLSKSGSANDPEELSNTRSGQSSVSVLDLSPVHR